ncbi:helix-turn-helix domain-containing protein [Devosia sp.]|uniref:winged helix-turn-helix transcriptional regulator n=1 Tax=Devosia sp. TaxID=1871048 RepID=UPI001AC20F91|nr:helix-turn-helix domain-containing protein [Devosia sp.]MBN9336038.1 helix-turn-helix transcriptional regulator [Devosia sp.]
MARSVDILGDWGSLMILRQAFSGTTRFDDFQKELDLSRNLLTARLKKLVERGVLERRLINEDGRRHEYVLTEMGEDLLTTVVALRQWGDRWLFKPDLPPVTMVDARDGREIQQVHIHAADGRELTRSGLRLRPRVPESAS